MSAAATPAGTPKRSMVETASPATISTGACADSSTLQVTRLQLDRTGVALLGAIALISVNPLCLQEAARAVLKKLRRVVIIDRWHARETPDGHSHRIDFLN